MQKQIKILWSTRLENKNKNKNNEALFKKPFLACALNIKQNKIEDYNFHQVSNPNQLKYKNHKNYVAITSGMWLVANGT